VDLPTFSVGQLLGTVRELLSLAFPDEVWVEGEISSLRRTRAGHVYFDLVEPAGPERFGRAGATNGQAVISVVLFDRARREVNASLGSPSRVRMTDGVRIRLRGRLEVWAGSGRVQLKMSAIDPAFTLGQMATDRDRVLAALAGADLLGRNALVPLPMLPLRVGLVTSVGSAAHADVLHELTASGFGFHVCVVDAQVQGPGAARSLVAGIGAVVDAGVDAVLVARGGGARTDLLAFDDESVARAVATCPVPVVVGIGHETDRTVVDDVAHTACKTPTAGAALLVGRVREAVARLDGCARQVGWLAPRTLDRVAVALDEQGTRLQGRATRCLERADARFDLAAAGVSAADPARALARGWSFTHTADGTLVRDPSQVATGDVLVTTVEGGRLRSVVTADAPDPRGEP